MCVNHSPWNPPGGAERATSLLSALIRVNARAVAAPRACRTKRMPDAAPRACLTKRVPDKRMPIA